MTSVGLCSENTGEVARVADVLESIQPCFPYGDKIYAKPLPRKLWKLRPPPSMLSSRQWAVRGDLPAGGFDAVISSKSSKKKCVPEMYPALGCAGAKRAFDNHIYVYLVGTHDFKLRTIILINIDLPSLLLQAQA